MVMIFVDAHTHRVPASGTLAVMNLHRDEVVVPADGLWSVGIHPWFIREGSVDGELARLRTHLELPRVVALGECGLDRLAKTAWALQREVFLRQLELAQDFGKPVIIHNVRSGSDLLQIRKGLTGATPWLLHGFHGTIREAELFVQQGCYLSFGRGVLDSGSRASRACAATPLERILPESDDAPLETAAVTEAIARIKNLDTGEVISALYANFVRLYLLHHHD
jgi:TatD DNase family protein